MTSKSGFKAVPQRAPHSYNPDWTKDLLAEKEKRTPNNTQLAINRAKMDALIAKVARGEITPVYLPAGRPHNTRLPEEQENF